MGMLERILCGRRGMTLLEILLALFILMVGLVGVMAALPTGMTSASWVILQDAAIHLAHSKFAEFRRDRIDPATDLINGSPYLPSAGSYVAGKQEPPNSSPGGEWRDFAAAPGQPYQYFDDIWKYEWRVEIGRVFASAAGNPAPPTGHLAPSSTSGTELNLKKVTLIVRMKGTTREFRFSRYMCAYD